MSRVSWNCTFCNFMFCGNCINWETWCFWSTLAENLEAFAQAPDGLPMVSYKFWSRNKAGEEGGHHFFTSICWSPNLEVGGRQHLGRITRPTAVLFPSPCVTLSWTRRELSWLRRQTISWYHCTVVAPKHNAASLVVYVHGKCRLPARNEWSLWPPSLCEWLVGSLLLMAPQSLP